VQPAQLLGRYLDRELPLELLRVFGVVGHL
jgi:hypothetical protein